MTEPNTAETSPRRPRLTGHSSTPKGVRGIPNPKNIVGEEIRHEKVWVKVPLSVSAIELEYRVPKRDCMTKRYPENWR